MTIEYDHLIEISSRDRKLVIHRIYRDGRKELFTSVELPTVSTEENKAQLENFFLMLGENLMLDSPMARKLLNL